MVWRSQPQLERDDKMTPENHFHDNASGVEAACKSIWHSLEVQVASAPALALLGGATIQMLPKKLCCRGLVGGHHYSPLGCHLGAIF